MRLKTIDSPKIEPWEGSASISADPAISPYGRPIVISDEDDPISVIDFQNEFEIVEATPEEIEALKKGGYILPTVD